MNENQARRRLEPLASAQLLDARRKRAVPVPNGLLTAPRFTPFPAYGVDKHGRRIIERDLTSYELLAIAVPTFLDALVDHELDKAKRLKLKPMPTRTEARHAVIYRLLGIELTGGAYSKRANQRAERIGRVRAATRTAHAMPWKDRKQQARSDELGRALWPVWEPIVQKLAGHEADALHDTRASLIQIALTDAACNLPGTTALDKPQSYWWTIARNALSNKASQDEQRRSGVSGISAGSHANMARAARLDAASGAEFDQKLSDAGINPAEYHAQKAALSPLELVDDVSDDEEFVPGRVNAAAPDFSGDTVEHMLAVDLLSRLLADLDGIERQVYLGHHDGMTWRELAAALDRSESGVRAIFRRANIRVQARVAENTGELDRIFHQ